VLAVPNGHDRQRSMHDERVAALSKTVWVRR